MEEILHVLFHALYHSFIDAIKLLPFLFVTYLLMEFIEHTAGDKATKIISRSGKVGPLVAGLLGGLPQCQFSAASAGLYSGRVITIGTLFAVFLSTSDEMIPVMISNSFPVKNIFTLILTKIVFAVLVGFIIDFVFKKRSSVEIGNICEEEGCHCENGIFRSALHHTINVFFFILAVGFFLEAVIGFIGENSLQKLFNSQPVISNFVSAFVGLIPNCAASVVICELYLEKVISAGAMMSGLFTGAGVGTLVLFKTNKNLRENFIIIISLWIVGALLGVLLDGLGFQNLLN